MNRLVPRLSGLAATISGMSFNWKRLVGAEYNSAFIWIVACQAAILRNVRIAGNPSPRNPLVAGLIASLAATVVLYALARILKKSGKLRQAAA